MPWLPWARQATMSYMPVAGTVSVVARGIVPKNNTDVVKVGSASAERVGDSAPSACGCISVSSYGIVDAALRIGFLIQRAEPHRPCSSVGLVFRASSNDFTKIRRSHIGARETATDKRTTAVVVTDQAGTRAARTFVQVDQGPGRRRGLR